MGYNFATLCKNPKEVIYISSKMVNSVLLHRGQVVTVDGYGKDAGELSQTLSDKASQWRATKVMLEEDTPSVQMGKSNKTPTANPLPQATGSKQIVHDSQNVKPTLDMFRNALRAKGPLPVQLLCGRIHGKKQQEVKAIIEQWPNVFEVRQPKDTVYLRTKTGVEANVVCTFMHHCIATLTAGAAAEEVFIPHKSLPEEFHCSTTSQPPREVLRVHQRVIVDVEGRDKCDNDDAQSQHIAVPWMATKTRVFLKLKTRESTTQTNLTGLVVGTLYFHQVHQN